MTLALGLVRCVGQQQKTALHERGYDHPLEEV